MDINEVPANSSGITSSFKLRIAIVTFLIANLIYKYVKKRQQDNADKRFGAKHHCLPAHQRLSYKWPLALDIFKMQYEALMSGHLLKAQSEYLQKNSLAKTYEVKPPGRIGIFTTDPVNVQAIIVTHFEDYGLGSRREGFYPMIGEGIFTQDGEPWRHSRDVMRRQFVRMQYQDLKVFEGPVDTLLAGLKSSARGIVDLQPFFFRFTLNTTTSLIFGEPFAGLDPAENEQFQIDFNYSGLITAMRVRLAEWYWLYNPTNYKKSCSMGKRYAMQYVDHALKDMNENGTEEASKRHPFIIDLYQELRDPVLIRDQLMNILMAGRDTTACLMTWAHLLIRHPKTLARLRDEIISTTGESKVITRAQINKMTYLKYVLNETNRLYAVVPVNVRMATNTTFLPRGGGSDGLSPLLVPKGMGIVFSPYHMHRDPDIYGDDANEFRPERWEDDRLKNIGLGFMPFHGGPRICLGKDFALTEASYGIVRVLQTFPDIHLPPSWEILPSGREKQALTLVLRSGEGCNVVLE
ncbi:hypothetical protein EAF04_005189 [Stromatinia cepivora]|nr:hypothetical protein EAF04_005189 [Stromatinia cepivora]